MAKLQIEIAKKLKLSPMTVSRALRGIGRVNEETRQRVLECAKELGCARFEGIVFNPTIRKGTSDHCPKILIPFFYSQELYENYEGHQRMMKGIQDSLLRFEGKLIQYQFKGMDDFLNHVSENSFTGTIIRENIPAEWVYEIQKKIPTVMALTNYPFSGIDSVNQNEFCAAHQILRELSEKKHKNIVFLGIFDRDYPGSFDHLEKHLSPVDRVIHFSDSSLHACWKMLSSYKTEKCNVNVVIGERNHKKATLESVVSKSLKSVFHQKSRPTAFVAESDYVALEILKWFKKMGKSVPHDFSVISYGNSAMSRDSDLGITSVDFDYETIGKTAYELLERRRSNPFSRAISLNLETKLIRRESVSVRVES